MEWSALIVAYTLLPAAVTGNKRELTNLAMIKYFVILCASGFSFFSLLDCFLSRLLPL